MEIISAEGGGGGGREGEGGRDINPSLSGRFNEMGVSTQLQETGSDGRSQSGQVPPTNDSVRPQADRHTPQWRGGFEFHSIGPKDESRGIPSVNDWERELLSQLTTAKKTERGVDGERGGKEGEEEEEEFSEAKDRSNAKDSGQIKRASGLPEKV